MFLLGCFLFVSVSIASNAYSKRQFLSVGDESSFQFSPPHAPLQDFSTRVPSLRSGLSIIQLYSFFKVRDFSNIGQRFLLQARVSAPWCLLSKHLVFIIQISFCYSHVRGGKWFFLGAVNLMLLPAFYLFFSIYR